MSLVGRLKRPVRRWKAELGNIFRIRKPKLDPGSSVPLPNTPIQNAPATPAAATSADLALHPQISPTNNVNIANSSRPTVTSPGGTAILAHNLSSTSAQSQSYVAPNVSHTTNVPPTTPNVPSSPTTTVAHSGIARWKGAKTFLKVLDQSAGVFGPLKAVVDEFVACVDVYEQAANGRSEYETLQLELEGIFEDLHKHFGEDTPPAVTMSMEGLCKSIKKELRYVREKQTNMKSKRRLSIEAEAADDILACYQRIQSHLQRLLLNADLSVWKIVDNQAMNNLLDRLHPSLSARYKSGEAVDLKRGPCTPGTRVDVLAQMLSWIRQSGTGLIYWMNGMAGTGKTTISYSLCSVLDAERSLAASFFCSRLLPECRNVNLIIPSIAYQLARFSHPFRCALARILEKDPDVHTCLPHIQFDALISKPLAEVQGTLPSGLVVVIDALDECENQESTGHILDVLLAKASSLPIKFVLSSRPEPEIRSRMVEHANSRVVLHELDKDLVQADIETYLKQALAPMKPSELQITTLVEHSGILFIYAATAVRYISPGKTRRNPAARLETVLNTSSSGGTNKHKEIDELYAMILKAALDDPSLDDEERLDTKLVLDTVICTQEPLTISAICGLLNIQDINRVRSALEPLWSVLHVVEDTEIVTALHASFSDFMFNPSRSGSYHCDAKLHHDLLARLCFGCVKRTTPQFNICELESSYILDKDVPDIETRVKKAIPTELFYVSRYWAAHLLGSGGSAELRTELEDFLSRRLLLWMEVMNLKKSSPTMGGMMQAAEEWCMRRGLFKDLEELIHDEWRFTSSFALNAVSQSTPHIYMSMLPFWPRSSPIGRLYASRTRGMIEAEGPAMTRQQLALLATWSFGGGVISAAFSPDGSMVALGVGPEVHVVDAFSGKMILDPLKGHASLVMSVAFSPDGTRIVSGSHDQTIRLWDVRSGTMLLDPLQGHTDAVNSVEFSPDGARIVSGSDDMSIRLWDAQSGKAVLAPLNGHAHSVQSVGFSPDGTRIVSGSTDQTIRLWNAQSGKALLHPFEGHTQPVMSVGFSPDGTRIVSGSIDTTIRLWDAQTGRMVLDPLEGHTHSVVSVEFSPDGARIVSSSYDKTIRLWDARTGKMMHSPLKGHSDPIWSARFSPDGIRILSGSSDKTIRLWDSRSGGVEPNSLTGHTEAVLSVAFSPDGSRIISGSWDTTLRLWDAQSGHLVLDPLRGHTGSIWSVAFSPDGTRIVSGSWDNTVRLWDSRSGKMLLKPLEGHTDGVASVRFSPDNSRIASGAYDKTIRLWDAQNGNLLLDPIEGHTETVLSAEFSPDGSRIVSGSGDNTIRLWDARSGKMILDPLQGHTDSVTSVRFSPDGKQIVSGSNDATIRLWDSRTGTTLLHLLVEPSYPVTQSGLSSGSANAASNSEDKSVLYWDPRTGKMILDPLKRYLDPIYSVGFSPDGTRIVSSSGNNIIRVWDVQSGKMVLDPFHGHICSAMSVGFSPDGTRIVSGLNDHTIRVYDVRNSRALAPNSISWELCDDGWVVDKKSQRLIWVPSHLRSLLMRDRSTLLISASGFVRLNFRNARLGDLWTGCYLPA
ncbi:Notchless protein [Ceratobasidium theobromae]|uniref:Notchless protein n=1 Tax=Ceratobasidium theobromae TaxID=1582974 RepID=A0A5N5QC58_9AGAM|nr:Notchless protein [Ceratobasidium theobromae]